MEKGVMASSFGALGTSWGRQMVPDWLLGHMCTVFLDIYRNC
jgi:hypothetical protein